jgi:formylglycine-generating enzyme required for sulfatase activity
VFRGGAWNDAAPDLGPAVRGRAPADQRGANIGFRVARSLAP